MAKVWRVVAADSSLATLLETLGQSQPPDGWASLLDQAWIWGQRTNLTAAKDRAALCEILFVDAWHLWKSNLAPKGARVVDVGAGVGAPTIPLLCVRPDLSAVLVEPRRKRVAFLRHVVGELQLQDRVDVVESKVNPREPAVHGAPFDVALSRATFDPADWLRLGSHLASDVLLFMARQDPPALDGWKVTQRVDYRVPSSDAPRAILRFTLDPVP